MDIAMEWDGETATAKLHLDGCALEGHPRDVEHVFHRLNAESNTRLSLESRIRLIEKAVREMVRELERSAA